MTKDDFLGSQCFKEFFFITRQAVHQALKAGSAQSKSLQKFTTPVQGFITACVRRQRKGTPGSVETIPKWETLPDGERRRVGTEDKHTPGFSPTGIQHLGAANRWAELVFRESKKGDRAGKKKDEIAHQIVTVDFPHTCRGFFEEEGASALARCVCAHLLKRRINKSGIKRK